MVLLDSWQRKPPQPPSILAKAANKTWEPWTLDRIDQRSLPLDGEFRATATGSGVNVYIVSTASCWEAGLVTLQLLCLSAACLPCGMCTESYGLRSPEGFAVRLFAGHHAGT